MSTIFVDDWATIASTRRLGASVEELARETLEEIMGFEGKGGHKPARSDIQKLKDVYDLYERCHFDYGEPGAHDDEKAIGAAREEWADKYELTQSEKSMINAYNSLMRDNTPEEAFQKLALLMDRTDPDYQPAAFAFPGYPPEGKKAAGMLLKRYEQFHYPQLYQGIKRALDDMYRRNTASYKLWPWAVKQMKESFQGQLAWGGVSEPGRGAIRFDHIADIATEGGELLSKLRAENRIPQNFDVNRLDFKEFEQWLMDWKREHREAEAQGEVVYQFHDGWTVQKLTTADQLQFEGDEMGHCVGGYSHSVSNGQIVIYSLRDPKGMPHVTVEVEALEGAPSYGFGDGEEVPEDAAFNHEYIHPDKHAPAEHMEDIGGDYIPSGENAFQVVQVQGNSNSTPKPEYQRKIREFLDSLRAKGWKFARSENWYAPHDQQYGRDEYGESVKGARDLDEWFDNAYKTEHEVYRGVNHEDAYGLPRERMTVGIGDWKELFESIFGSLVEEYDPGRYRGNWRDLAQAVYHAWAVDIYKDHLDPEALKAHEKNLVEELQSAEETLMEWEHNQWYYASEHHQEDIAEKFEEIAERRGVWAEMVKKLDEEHGEDMWGEREINDEGQDLDEDIWMEANDEVRNKEMEYYSGDAWKFVQYVIFLAEKHGMVNPAELPDPNERHAGLPSFEDLEQMPWKTDERVPTNTPVEEGLPGALSSWQPLANDGYIAPDAATAYPLATQAFIDAIEQSEAGNSRAVDSASFQAEQVLIETYGLGQQWAYAHARSITRLYEDKGIEALHAITSMPPAPSEEFSNEAWPDTLPWGEAEQNYYRTASGHDIQIYPIDHEHNVWFDEDGNAHERYRPGWRQDESGNRYQLQDDELEDTFLDKQGRQGQGYVAYHGDNPVGSLTYVADPAGWHMLGTTFVHPDYREQGLFNRMVAPLRESGRPIDAYVWNNPWLKQKVRSWRV